MDKSREAGQVVCSVTGPMSGSPWIESSLAGRHIDRIKRARNCGGPFWWSDVTYVGRLDPLTSPNEQLDNTFLGPLNLNEWASSVAFLEAKLFFHRCQRMPQSHLIDLSSVCLLGFGSRHAIIRFHGFLGN